MMFAIRLLFILMFVVMFMIMVRFIARLVPALVMKNMRMMLIIIHSNHESTSH
jgi:hypothetical protein